MTALTRLIDAYRAYRNQGYGAALAASMARQHSRHIGDRAVARNTHMAACNDKDTQHMRVGNRIV